MPQLQKTLDPSSPTQNPRLMGNQGDSLARFFQGQQRNGMREETAWQENRP